MKSITIALLILLLNIAYCQIKSEVQIPTLKKTVQLSEENQLNILIEFILQHYGESFRFYKELRNGNYIFQLFEKGNNTNGGFLIIFERGSPKHTIAKIKLKKVKNENGNIELVFENDEFKKYIDHAKLSSMNCSTGLKQITQIIEKNNILWDKMILYNPDIPEEYWRILNRGFTMEYLENQYGDPAICFNSAWQVR